MLLKTLTRFFLLASFSMLLLSSWSQIGSAQVDGANETESEATMRLVDYMDMLAIQSFEEISSKIPEVDQQTLIQPEEVKSRLAASYDAVQVLLARSKASAKDVARKLLVENPDVIVVQHAVYALKFFVVFPLMISHGYLAAIPIAYVVFSGDIHALHYFAWKNSAEARKIKGLVGRSLSEISTYKRMMTGVRFGEKLRVQSFKIEGKEFFVQIRDSGMWDYYDRLRGNKNPFNSLKTSDLEALLPDKSWLKEAADLRSVPELYDRVLMQAILSKEPSRNALLDKLGKDGVWVDQSPELRVKLHEIDSLRTMAEASILKSHDSVKNKISALGQRQWSILDSRTFSIQSTLAELTGDINFQHRKLREYEAQVLVAGMEGKLDKTSISIELEQRSAAINTAVGNLDAYVNSIQSAKSPQEASTIAANWRTSKNSGAQACLNLGRTMARGWF